MSATNLMGPRAAIELVGLDGGADTQCFGFLNRTVPGCGSALPTDPQFRLIGAVEGVRFSLTQQRVVRPISKPGFHTTSREDAMVKVLVLSGEGGGTSRTPAVSEDH